MWLYLIGSWQPSNSDSSQALRQNTGQYFKLISPTGMELRNYIWYKNVLSWQDFWKILFIAGWANWWSNILEKELGSSLEVQVYTHCYVRIYALSSIGHGKDKRNRKELLIKNRLLLGFILNWWLVSNKYFHFVVFNSIVHVLSLKGRTKWII